MAILQQHGRLSESEANEESLDSPTQFKTFWRWSSQHVRDREADIEGRKSGAWCICNAPKARPTFGLCFRAKKEAHGEARRAEPTSPFLVASDQKTPNSSPRRLAIGCFQANQYVTLSSSVLFWTIALQQTVLPPSHALILCAIARKPLLMTDFSKTGSRNMAETCAINLLTLVSYSTSIVIGGLSALVLPILMWAGPDLENFAQNRQSAVLGFFPMFDHPLQKN